MVFTLDDVSVFRLLHACSLVENCDTSVSEVEESLTEVTSLPSDVTKAWIAKSMDDVRERIVQFNVQHQKLEMEELKAKVVIVSFIAGVLHGLD